MQKAFSLLYNADPIYQQIIDRNKPLLPNWIEHTVYDKPMHNYTQHEYRFISDSDRIDRLIEDPTAWYWDADTVFIKPIDFDLKPNRLYMQYKMGVFDICLILGNGCLDMLKYIRSKFDPDRPIKWYDELINGELKGDIEPIPSGYFNHLALHHATTHVKEGGLIGGYGYTLGKINGELKLRIR